MQCESMEWRKRWAGRAARQQPAVYRTFSTNHLSYTKTLVPIYIFRAITFFDGAPKLKKLCRELFFEKP